MPSSRQASSSSTSHTTPALSASSWAAFASNVGVIRLAGSLATVRVQLTASPMACARSIAAAASSSSVIRSTSSGGRPSALSPLRCESGRHSANSTPRRRLERRRAVERDVRHRDRRGGWPSTARGAPRRDVVACPLEVELFARPGGDHDQPRRPAGVAIAALEVAEHGVDLLLAVLARHPLASSLCGADSAAGACRRGRRARSARRSRPRPAAGLLENARNPPRARRVLESG